MLTVTVSAGDKPGLRIKDCGDHNNLYGSENHPRHTMVSAEGVRARAEAVGRGVPLKPRGALALLVITFLQFQTILTQSFRIEDTCCP